MPLSELLFFLRRWHFSVAFFLVFFFLVFGWVCFVVLGAVRYKVTSKQQKFVCL